MQAYLRSSYCKRVCDYQAQEGPELSIYLLSLYRKLRPWLLAVLLCKQMDGRANRILQDCRWFGTVDSGCGLEAGYDIEMPQPRDDDSTPNMIGPLTYNTVRKFHSKANAPQRRPQRLSTTARAAAGVNKKGDNVIARRASVVLSTICSRLK
ncbi:hypothetical protein EVAR_5582_1 [Eumeta japonica]|uniref:Uncharacterized protein n=1 Tax=Eumeta variegata TaxID=151549 RepID=A0A4C1U1H2_EUMVA|nr:hypothetical protein EVAR_5582_1 [Eumeta japonica]